jgi:pilus assembly protein Flp/PilA
MRSRHRRCRLEHSSGRPAKEKGKHVSLRSLIASVRRDEEGQGLAEYALILALIAIVAIIALIFLGTQVSTILSTVGNSV